MKTKRLFFLAAMLLMSVCGFAQSGGVDPIPGDVNGDGVVDVGDIVAVINGAATGDVNNDGNVDGDDITAIIDIIQSNNENAPVTYKYYLGVISEDDIMNQAAVNAIINNTSTTTNAPLSSITLPSGAPSNNGYEHIFIYPLAWGTPSVINHNTLSPVGLSPLDDWEILNPAGYGAFYLDDPKSNAGAVFDITWSNN